MIFRPWCANGADRARTDNPHVANVVLSQLSYGPVAGSIRKVHEITKPSVG